VATREIAAFLTAAARRVSANGAMGVLLVTFSERGKV